ncbi:putative selenocysteine lyase [Magnetofaba australis IT-1]|uniref:Putative selenocysteine lyase n=1 Tax=Magnetofaba australis IT-1 TaxID=1434232 RepID=A0A1Y2K4X9_9PROT|nr:putative selenocysteine lyase [Magnetofaba australis IT-1]
MAPIPQRTARVIMELADHANRYGASRYDELARRHEQARAVCAQLLHTEPGRVAFAPNTSEALCWVALGMAWKPGDEIVTTAAEFPSNAIIWLDIAQRHGVTVHRVPLERDGRVSTVRLLEHVNKRTRLLSVSSAQFSNGALADLKALGAALKDSDALFVVDAIQTLGALDLDPHALHIDALAADGHKWMLGPEGQGLFWLSDKGMAQITPRILGWHSVATAGNHDIITTELRGDMRRFESGTPNLMGVLALAESVSMILEAGMQTVQGRVTALATEFVWRLRQLECKVHTPVDADGVPGAGIVVFSHPRHQPEALSRKLAAQGVYHAPRGAGLRFAAHFYQDEDDVDAAMDALARCL